jgi:hypothetical protein
MFESLFASKNKKLVLAWSKEHEKIVVLAQKVIAAYSLDDVASVRKHLLELRTLAINHLMIEDIEFHKLLRDEKRVTDEISNSVHEFTESFHDTKIVLRDFLRQSVHEDAVYDEKFFKTFNSLVEALVTRIEYEETHLYNLLKEK